MLVWQQQQQQVNANSQLEINLGREEEGLVETLQEIEHEIECPRCNDVMTLCALFKLFPIFN